jgi:hypothetical protein
MPLADHGKLEIELAGIPKKMQREKQTSWTQNVTANQCSNSEWAARAARVFREVSTNAAFV